MGDEIAQSLYKLGYGLEGPSLEYLQWHYNFFSKRVQRGYVAEPARYLLGTDFLRG
jgi:hypothetical protein